jgi:hypothetical protein
VSVDGSAAGMSGSVAWGAGRGADASRGFLRGCLVRFFGRSAMIKSPYRRRESEGLLLSGSYRKAVLARIMRTPPDNRVYEGVNNFIP